VRYLISLLSNKLKGVRIMKTQKEIIKDSNRKVRRTNRRIDDLHIVDRKTGVVVTDVWTETK
jgi:hypothetical protein